VGIKTGKKIRLAMVEAGLTQKTLGEKLNVTGQAISRWITGLGEPTIPSLEKIAKATNKPISYFFDDSQTNISTGDNVVVGKSHNVTSGVNSNGTLEFELLKKDMENLKLKVDLILEQSKEKNKD
jgi:transcriptional regulator with XRE-family HTH domain